MTFKLTDGGRREAYLVALFFLATAVLSALVLYSRDRYSFLYFGDAASHIVKARQFIDGNTPGGAPLGTVWLPLPHLLLIPAVAVNALFYSGLAGAVTGIPMYAGTCALLFLIVRRLTGSPAPGLLAASLFGLNPNVVYIALTPMNESALFFFLALGGYAFLRWRDEGRTRWLAAAAVSVMLATLCRYEAWILPPFITFAAIRHGRGRRHAEKSGEGARPALFPPAALAIVSFLGILTWLAWNLYRYGDALTFARWTYNIAPRSLHEAAGRAWYQGVLVYARALLFVFGPAVICVSAGIFMKQAEAARRRAPVLIFFALPALFTVASIAADFVQIDAWRWNWRLVLPAGLFFAIAASLGLVGVFGKIRSEGLRAAAVAVLLLMPLMQLEFSQIGVAVYDDAHRVFSADPRGGAYAGEFLQGEYTGGGIALVTGYGQAERIMVSSGIPLREFHILRNPAEAEPLAAITGNERFLVIGLQTTPESAPYVERWLARMDTLLAAHALRSDDGHYVILERRGL